MTVKMKSYTMEDLHLAVTQWDYCKNQYNLIKKKTENHRKMLDDCENDEARAKNAMIEMEAKVRDIVKEVV